MLPHLSTSLLKNFQVCLKHRIHQLSMIQGPFNFIGGKRVPCLQPLEKILVTEPATGELLCELPCSGEKDIDSAVESARNAFESWSQFSPTQRSTVLQTAAKLIQERLNEIACLEVRDSGKPLWEAKADIIACADAFKYFGGVILGHSGLHVPLTNTSFAMVQREPLGVCGGIGAWNFPFLVASWKAAPALACGNAVIYKPSQFSPLTAIMLAEILHDAGIPEGCYNVVQGAGLTGKLLCEHPGIAKISFTGSVETGVKVMTSCAQKIKHVTLELGGKSPLIIFDDCDLDNAIKATMVANFLSQGQVCSNATRVFVQKTILNEFLSKLVTETNKLKIGDPFDENTKIGATITKEHAEKVLRYIEGAVSEGAKVLCGGKRINLSDAKLKNGYYLSPCILANCTDDMKAVKEEIFGAVVSILSFDSEKEVIHRANNTNFGLAGGVFTKDISQGHRVAKQIQAGIVWINNYNLYPPEVPFGGYKMSGIGRENGLQVLEHYSQTKTVMVELSDVESPFT